MYLYVDAKIPDLHTIFVVEARALSVPIQLTSEFEPKQSNSDRDGYKYESSGWNAAAKSERTQDKKLQYEGFPCGHPP
jgi:hypothetical protein